ncbi:Uncharacterized protein SCF082_LOCUS51685 [Durusdinium trenchii]|uniref:Secreted protein n=1 Tax=Durusdinium trenchii TaxID=1381693 RepID=A0ABP0SG55_9DINO
MMALHIFLLLCTSVSAASDTPPPALNLKNEVQADDPTSSFQALVARPLMTAANKVDKEVDRYLQEVATVVEEDDKEKGIKSLLKVSADIRTLLDEVVPMLLSARDNSSAFDIDPRPSARSQATYAQKVLNKLQTYTSWAWPVIGQYTTDAYDHEKLSEGIESRMQRGTDGSLSYLSSVLLYAWKAAEYQFPVVEAMMQRNDSSGEILMKAGCAASYAQLLGDITQMYGDLSDSKVECFVPNTTQVHWRKCAFDATQSLQMVTQAISEAANAMWQCFGIYWGCSQLTNTAYSQLVKAMTASLEMSKNCKAETYELCKPYAFEAMASLSQAAGQMNSATNDCVIKGGSTLDPLNPWAATPFEKREDAPDASV